MMHVVTFYLFKNLPDPDNLTAKIESIARTQGCVGSVLIADEGINSTLACDSKTRLQTTVASIEHVLGDVTLSAKYSTAHDDNEVFYRLKVKHRKEVINFGQPLQTQDQVAQHVNAQEWNKLTDQPDTWVLDVRNTYEVEVGQFESAQSLNIKHFRDFPQAVEGQLPKDRETPIAMYCTGGIRCEKASNWLYQRGYKNLFQLEDGILKYLEDTNTEESKWQGECFVFDQRVTVNHLLEQGRYNQCFACRRPISQAEQQSEDFVEGVSCPNCVDETMESRKLQFAERMRQQQLARSRGESHIGRTLEKTHS